MILTGPEIRVLGCLIEKANTTPDHYPLTTNSLVTACNQKTNREPVVDYDARTVSEAMMSLRGAGLARTITGSGRTEKHRHVADEALGLDAAAEAVLAVLLLRGPQTPGELRLRTDRYLAFDSVEAVEEVLDGLARADDPLVANLGRAPGQSQDRWMHLLGDPTEVPEPGAVVADAAPGGSFGDRLAALEALVGSGEEADGPDGGEAEPLSLTDRVAAIEDRLSRLETELGLDG